MAVASSLQLWMDAGEEDEAGVEQARKKSGSTPLLSATKLSAFGVEEQQRRL